MKSCHSWRRETLYDQFEAIGRWVQRFPGEDSAKRPAVVPIHQCPASPQPKIMSSMGIGPGDDESAIVFDGLSKVDDWAVILVSNLFRGQRSYSSSPDDYLASAWAPGSKNTHWSRVETPYTVFRYRKREPKLRYVTDGTSKTVLVSERAGLPMLWCGRHQGRGLGYHGAWLYNDFNGRLNRLDASSDTACRIVARYLEFETMPSAPRINGGNYTGLFSFHSGGVNTGFCDGSVRFLADDTDMHAVVELYSRAGDDYTLN